MLLILANYISLQPRDPFSAFQVNALVFMLVSGRQPGCLHEKQGMHMKMLKKVPEVAESYVW